MVLHYIYELPQLNVLARGQFAPECHNVFVFDLADLWISKHIMIPEIGLHFLWCTSIAEMLLRMHTAGWVHKGIFSGSIIFVHTSDAVKSPIPPDFDDNAQKVDGRHTWAIPHGLFIRPSKLSL